MKGAVCLHTTAPGWFQGDILGNKFNNIKPLFDFVRMVHIGDRDSDSNRVKLAKIKANLSIPCY